MRTVLGILKNVRLWSTVCRGLEDLDLVWDEVGRLFFAKNLAEYTP